MKKTVLLCMLSLPLLIAIPALAQKDLEEAELGFARMAKEKNVREAFLHNFAEEGIIMLPAPSSGKKFYGAQQPSQVVLEWKPAIVVLAGSKDFGYTTGPAQAKGSPESNEYFYYGQFISIWEKGENGWKVLFDTGIPHQGPHANWEMNEAQSQALTPVSYAPASITDIESEFMKLIEKKGTQQAYKQKSYAQTRFMRHKHIPQSGLKAIPTFFPAKSKVVYKPINGKVSVSNDLAYNYGSYEFTGGDTPEQGYYMRIWKRNQDGWQLELEVWKPEEKK